MSFSKSSSLATALVGAAGGALAIYFMDPTWGRERRERFSAAANDTIGHARQHLQRHIDSLAELAKEHGTHAQQAAADAVAEAVGPVKEAVASRVSNASAAASDARKFVSDAWDRAQSAIEEARHRSRRAAAVLTGDDEEHASPVIPVVLTAAAFCAAGVGLMWALDPDRGRAPGAAQPAGTAHRFSNGKAVQSDRPASSQPVDGIRRGGEAERE